MKKRIPFGGLRILYLIFALFLQLSAIYFVMHSFQRHFAYFQLVSTLLSLLVVMHIIKEDTSPSFKIPWIVLNLSLPVLGAIAYLLYGNIHFTARERQFVSDVIESHRSILQTQTDYLDELNQINPQAALQARYLALHAHAPLYQGTSVQYFPLGELFWASLLKDLQGAKKFIFMEYFIITPGTMWDAIEEILIQKAHEGVDVRLMYDYFGSLLTVPRDFRQRLEDKGVKVNAFNQRAFFFDARFQHRDHRKITVIDGDIGYTGGINLADEYINAYVKHGHWKDTAIRLQGDALRSLSAHFLAMWSFETKTKEDLLSFSPSVSQVSDGFIQPFADEPLDAERVGETAYMNIIHRAVDYVYIMTPYLIIDSEMIRSMIDTAKSGVDVRILLPGIPDKFLVGILNRSYYQVLLDGGVRIYEYTPGFIHAKQFVSDDSIALVGTINLDYRSLVHHFENGVWLYGTSVSLPIKEDFLNTLKQSHEITPESLRRHGFFHHILLSILRLFSPMF